MVRVVKSFSFFLKLYACVCVCVYVYIYIYIHILHAVYMYIHCILYTTILYTIKLGFSGLVTQTSPGLACSYSIPTLAPQNS